MRFWPAVSTVSVSCEVCGLGCPSWLILLFMSLFVLHLLLRWDGLVPGLWPLLLLLCVGLLWGLCCAVLSPWHLVVPSSFSCASLGFFLWLLFGLGLVGCGPAWVPAFFWWGTLLPCPGCFHLAVPTVWLSRLLKFFLNSLLGFFPLASSFC